MTDAEIIERLFVREGLGAYTNTPGDRGGPTRWGITQATLSDWRGKPASESDVVNLSKDEAALIARKLYIERPGFDVIQNDALRECIVDIGFNSGTHAATRLLQRALGVKDDGIFGADTQAALVGMEPEAVLLKACRERALLYAKIVRDDPVQAKFIVGWTKRAWEFVPGLST